MTTIRHHITRSEHVVKTYEFSRGDRIIKNNLYTSKFKLILHALFGRFFSPEPRTAAYLHPICQTQKLY